MTIGKMLDTDPIGEAHRLWVKHGWADAADGMAAVTSLVRAQQILMQRILMLLGFSRTGALPMTRMGSLLQVHPTSVTSAVDRLEAQGFVARLPHPTDRRAVLASITETGRSQSATATTALNAQVFENLGITDNQVDQLRGVLRSLRANAGDF